MAHSSSREVTGWPSSVGGLFSVSMTPAPGKRPDEVEPLLYAELEKDVKEGVTDDDLSRARNAIRVARYFRLESNSGIRESLSQAESTGTSGNPFRTRNGPGPGPGTATVNPEW